MAEIVLDNVSKRFDDGYEAVKDMNLDDQGRRVRDPRRSLGVRQVDRAADDRRARGHHRGRAADRRRRRQPVRAQGPRHRDGVPELRALSAHERAREHGLPAEARQRPRCRDQGEGRARGEDPRPRAAPRPQTGEPLRRSAPAGGDGAGDRPRPEGVPDGRAALEPRREAAGADADRGLAAAEVARDDDRLRHPRPDRGDDARRPGRGDAGRRAAAGRRPGRALRAPREPVRRRLHRLAGDELHAGDARRRHGRSCRSATSACPTSSAAASAKRAGAR